MRQDMAVLEARFHAWLLRVGKWRVIVAITAVSTGLSVLMTWIGNVIFMPHVPVAEWLYISFIVPVLISPLVSSLVLSLVYQLAEAKAALVTMSETDPLTGVGNRRLFVARARQAVTEAVLMQTPLSIVLIDLDHFKRINDTHGHAVGDNALIMVATVCRNGLRGTDVFCRWGGEEFIALLPATSIADACVLAERLRANVVSTPVEGVPHEITISLGVAELSNGTETPDQVIANADRRLYRAKEFGRNRVEPVAPAATT